MSPLCLHPNITPRKVMFLCFWAPSFLSKRTANAMPLQTHVVRNAVPTAYIGTGIFVTPCALFSATVPFHRHLALLQASYCMKELCLSVARRFHNALRLECFFLHLTEATAGSDSSSSESSSKRAVPSMITLTVLPRPTATLLLPSRTMGPGFATKS